MPEAAQRAGDRAIVRHLTGPRRQDDQDRTVAAHTNDVVQQLDRRLVEPVGVVDRDHDGRRAVRARRQQLDDGAEEPLAARCRGGGAPELGHERRQLGAERGPDQVLRKSADTVDPRTVGPGRFALEGAPLDHATPSAARLVEQIADQAGLADAGLAQDRDRRA